MVLPADAKAQVLLRAKKIASHESISQTLFRGLSAEGLERSFLI